MTINGNSMMASYVSQAYSNKNVQSQSGASGYANQSGLDSTQNFDVIAQQIMTALDSNNSGSIDKTEFSQAAQALSRNTANSDNVNAAFAKADQNGDGEISSDEFLNAIKQASVQAQKHHHGHHDANKAETATAATSASEASSNASSPLSEMQKTLLTRIMAAYNNTAPTTGTTTNLSV